MPQYNMIFPFIPIMHYIDDFQCSSIFWMPTSWAIIHTCMTMYKFSSPVLSVVNEVVVFHVIEKQENSFFISLKLFVGVKPFLANDLITAQYLVFSIFSIAPFSEVSLFIKLFLCNS